MIDFRLKFSPWNILLLLLFGVIVFVLVKSTIIFNEVAGGIAFKNNIDPPASHIIIDNITPKFYVIKDSILDTVYYVPLETKEMSIIGQIDELIITNDHIVILDIFQTASIYIFDRLGSFIRKIHRIGDGPGEFTQPTDIVVDERNEQILLLHGFPSKIIKYNYEGKFEGEIDLPMRFRSFSLLQDGSIALVNEPRARKHGNPKGHFNEIFTKLVIITPSNEIIHSGGPINRAYEENISSNIQFGIIDNQGNVSFQPCFNDTIFTIEGYRTVPQFIVDFRDHKIEVEKVAGKKIDEFKLICKENDYYQIYGRHSQTNQILSFVVHAMSQDLLYLVYFNKESNKTLICQSIISNNPMNPASPIPTIAYNDYFVSIIEPDKFMKVKDAIDNYDYLITEANIKFTPPQEMLDRIDENSNPILCFFKLRPEKINMETVFLEEE